MRFQSMGDRAPRHAAAAALIAAAARVPLLQATDVHDVGVRARTWHLITASKHGRWRFRYVLVMLADAGINSEN